MDNFRVPCMEKSLKANSKALFILVKLLKNMMMEASQNKKYIKVS